MTGIDLFAVLGIGLGVLSMAVYLGLVIVAGVQVVKAPIARLSKLVWLAGIVVAPALGAIAWFGFGHGTREVERHVAGLAWNGGARH